MITALTIHILKCFLLGLFEGEESNISRAIGSAESDDYFKSSRENWAEVRHLSRKKWFVRSLENNCIF